MLGFMSNERDRLNSKLVFSTETGDLRKAEQLPASTPAASAKQKPVRLLLDTKARRGKTMTRISGIQHCPAALEDLAKKLKAACGAGGTVEDGDILIQGDHREKIAARLRELGIPVK